MLREIAGSDGILDCELPDSSKALSSLDLQAVGFPLDVGVRVPGATTDEVECCWEKIIVKSGDHKNHIPLIQGVGVEAYIQGGFLKSVGNEDERFFPDVFWHGDRQKIIQHH